MGNAVVAKPSEMTPTTATLLAEVLTAAGLPDGVFNVVHGFGAEIGGPLVSHPAIRGVSFTGGTSTGRVVAQAAIGDFKKLSLELGGKNATIVFADADVETTLAEYPSVLSESGPNLSLWLPNLYRTKCV